MSTVGILPVFQTGYRKGNGCYGDDNAKNTECLKDKHGEMGKKMAEAAETQDSPFFDVHLAIFAEIHYFERASGVYY